VGTCGYCHKTGKTISNVIGFCAHCIRGHFDQVWPQIAKVHAESRAAYGLPKKPPRDSKGKACNICVNRCRIGEGQVGFCGLRQVQGDKVKGGRPHEGNLSFYHDPLPTNCVAGFVCPGGTGCGFPRYAHKKGPEHGYANLAVFYQACSFNCLYCQNHHFKEEIFSSKRIHAKELAAAADHKTSCICYFGGDPGPQVLHALKTAKLARKKKDDEILRICWETNGSMNQRYLDMMAQIAMESGGSIKVDLKAWDEGLHQALCGVTNKKTLANFEALSTWIASRPAPPFLIASTLLVPGYVDEREVACVARFISALDPHIPYSLLGFYPRFFLNDLPVTSRSHAARCEAVAREAGLRQVQIGNAHLLGSAY
jgi:pyruvate formate lyase activating enzyme